MRLRKNWFGGKVAQIIRNERAMKKFIFFFILLFATVSLAGTPSQKLTVILDWFPNPDHAPLVIAQQKGFFKEQGLDVTLVGPADPNDPPKLVAAGKADLALTYEPQFMEQVDHGLPLIRVGTLIDKPLDCVVVLKDSGIQSIADLKGKKIGSTASGLSSLMLKVLLQKAGLKPTDAELVSVKYNLTQALLSHQVDAVTGMMRNFEVPQLEANGQKVLAFFPEEHGIPNYSVIIFTAHTKNIHDPRFPRFLAAVKKAIAYLDEHPKETWLLFAKQYPESDNPINREAWFSTMPYFAEDPANFDPEEWKNFAKFMRDNNMIKTQQPISRYAVMVS